MVDSDGTVEPMSDLPFGFSPSGDGDDNNRDKNRDDKGSGASGGASGGGESAQNPFGFALGGEPDLELGWLVDRIVGH